MNDNAQKLVEAMKRAAAEAPPVPPPPHGHVRLDRSFLLGPFPTDANGQEGFRRLMAQFFGVHPLSEPVVDNRIILGVGALFYDLEDLLPVIRRWQDKRLREGE